MKPGVEEFLVDFKVATINSRGAERALYLLLEAHKEKLPELDSYFHKAFRQTDVTGNGAVDIAIWHLIGESDGFWRAFDSAIARRNV